MVIFPKYRVFSLPGTGLGYFSLPQFSQLLFRVDDVAPFSLLGN